MAELKVNTTIDGNTAWQEGNDGATSGLDADTIDGNDTSYFATAGHGHDGTYARIDGNTTHSGNIYISGSTIYIRAAGSWKQIYPAVYS